MLSLPVLIGMIAAGIIAGVLAVHFLGGNKQSVLNSDTEVIARFRQDYPESSIGIIYFTRDHRAAFFDLPQQGTGIVHGVGAKFLTRILQTGDIQEIRKQDETRLFLRMHDFTWPAATFSFKDKKTRDVVCDWLART
ncbi:hypothetical protein [Pseudochrobactrum kiredjianiae]|uniref:Uncharacterized protein n=1 Tax=Pseudochrobactrum kiredjianiae TaxID=386305 RepID=A0ABW3V197_9HYPH|nr:hypothetical protein [Pseudochrobactrum kiredjianiae]MDM7851690.1 hypothetical protein [Pseudochrobactrum kiredjianiae]